MVGFDIAGDEQKWPLELFQGTLKHLLRHEEHSPNSHLSAWTTAAAAGLPGRETFSHDRTTSTKYVKDSVKPFRSDEAVFPTLGVTVHAGEWPSDSSRQGLALALEWGVDRLGHGCQLENTEGCQLENTEGFQLENTEGCQLENTEGCQLENTEGCQLENTEGCQLENTEGLLQRAANDAVTIECCPTANVGSERVSSLSAHPLPLFLRAGARACLSSDNLLASGGRDPPLGVGGASPMGEAIRCLSPSLGRGARTYNTLYRGRAHYDQNQARAEHPTGNNSCQVDLLHSAVDLRSQGHINSRGSRSSACAGAGLGMSLKELRQAQLNSVAGAFASPRNTSSTGIEKGLGSARILRRRRVATDVDSFSAGVSRQLRGRRAQNTGWGLAWGTRIVGWGTQIGWSDADVGAAWELAAGVTLDPSTHSIPSPCTHQHAHEDAETEAPSSRQSLEVPQRFFHDVVRAAGAIGTGRRAASSESQGGTCSDKVEPATARSLESVCNDGLAAAFGRAVGDAVAGEIRLLRADRDWVEALKTPSTRHILM